MPGNNSYSVTFNDQTVINRGITEAYLQDGVLYVVFSNGTVESLGPVSSYADAVANGLAGTGTDYPTVESWSQHIAGVTDLVALAEAWTNGTIGGAQVDTEELPSSYETAVSQGLAGDGTDYDTEAKWNAHVVGTPTQHHNSKYYATQAQTAATNLSEAVSSASDSATAAQAWAIGSTSTIDEPSASNNAHYWATQAATSASGITDMAALASASEQNAECWAVGTKNNVEIEPDEENPTAPSSVNNAKYYHDQTSILAQQAAQDALLCEGYVNGTQDGDPVGSDSDYYEHNIQYYSTTIGEAAEAITYLAQSLEASIEEAEKHGTSNIEVKYQISANSANPQNFNESDWTDSLDLSNSSGKYVWIRIKFTIGTEEKTMYAASYIGLDGNNANQILAYDVPTGATGSETQFPSTGAEGKIYLAKKLNTLYRWNPSLDPPGYDSVGGGGSGGGTPMSPASATTNGIGGTVPAPAAGDQGKFLRGDATWATVTSNTAGATNTSSKIFLIGATSQAAQPQTYSHDTAYVGEDGCLYSGGAKVLTAHQSIASKANDTAVVHNTGNETVAGVKTFTSTPAIKSTSNQYKYLNFTNGANTAHAYIRADSGNATNLTASQFCFVERSPKTTATTGDAGGGEYYYLPACNKDVATTVSYDIYTSKTGQAVAIANGGTGATTKEVARTNLGLGTAAVKNVETTLGTSSSNIPTSAAVATYVTGRGYLTAHQSLATCVKTTGNWSLAGTITFSGVISSTNTTAGASGAGAIKTSGGIYSAKAIYCGTTITAAGNITGAKVYNAVWNDYAECRQAYTDEPGYCVTETKNGVMAKTWERLQPGCKMISDTFGTCMGETDEAKTPIAVAGRVLAYPCRDISEYHLGDAVCSAPDGKIDIMTREEIREYPERIVGTVSEIPSYDVWYGGTKEDPQKIPVNGRIWIYVR